MFTAHSDLPVPDEINQSAVRSLNTLFILIYLIIYSYFSTGQPVSSYVWTSLSYLIVTLFLYLWSLRCVRLPYTDKERMSFRIAGFSGDIIVLSTVMLLAEQGGIPLFFLYIWITVANGIRYGTVYLIISAMLCILGFAVVVDSTSTWQNPDLIHVALGLFITLLILPAYILNLISRLSNALDRERASNQLKKEFVTNLNHELRTPLTSIVNLVELIKSNHVPGKINGMLDLIRTSTRNSLQIVNGILDLARIESGHYRFDAHPFNLYALIFEIRQLLVPQARNKGIKLFVYIDPGCRENMTGPADQIRMILTNLVGNSIKFTEKGFVSLSIKAVDAGNNMQTIAFLIEDTGIGIAKKYQKKIFKPYTQADTSIVRRFGGTGLGMAICDEISKNIGGEFVFHNDGGTGTKLTFNLKLSVSPDPEFPADTAVKITSCLPATELGGIIDTYGQLGIQLSVADPENPDDSAGILLAASSRIESLQDLDEDRVIMELRDPDQPGIHNGSVTSIAPGMSSGTYINALSICRHFSPGRSLDPNHLPYSPRRLDILLVEDDSVLREVQTTVFMKAGHNIDAANNGEDALSLYKRKQYDLVLADLHLPGMSGVELFREISGINPANKTRFMLLTADSEHANGQREYGADLAGILIKPVNPSELLDAIHGLFDISPDHTFYGHDMQRTGVQSAADNNPLSTFIDMETLSANISIMGISRYTQMLDGYHNEVDRQLQSLSKALTENEESEYYRILHVLKGISMSIGTIIFSRLVCFMEELKTKNTGLSKTRLMVCMQSVHELSMIAFQVQLGENRSVAD